LRIAYYMPFKPLGHPHPSGDLVIGTELFQFLRRRGHAIYSFSRLRTRWIYWKPWQWLRLPLEITRARRLAQQTRPHVWLTYHSYYKAPDVLGPTCATILGIPYALFQGVYATKRRRRMQTMPGFYLNRHALKRADVVFTNKRRDEINLRRLLGEDRLHYIAPGIHVDRFRAAACDENSARRRGAAGDVPVVLTAAMFRPGVKTEGIARVIRSCARAARGGHRFQLVICGDGATQGFIKRLTAEERLDGIARFTGRVPRDQMPRIYHGADLFVFPGIEEGLGMVYLEAQAAGLPVVACRGWGAAEIVRHNETGLLSDPGDEVQFDADLVRLVADGALRHRMGEAAADYVARHHDLERNYQKVEDHLLQLGRLNRSTSPRPQAGRRRQSPFRQR
jgi:glycosyltransferase involved in cell wall biosynthesis